MAQRTMPADRRLLRNEYRKIEEEARNNSEALSNVNSIDLQDLLRRTNDLHKQVVKPRESALDAVLFNKLTEAGFRATEKLVHNQQGRTVSDLIIALRHNYVHTSDPQGDGAARQSAFSWHELNDNVAKYFKAAPGVGCMLGPMDVHAKTRKVGQRQNRRPTGEAVRPEEMQGIQEQEKQETDRNMEEMWETLHQLRRCPVSELVCNHHCFAQTVENLFTLSFLVRDQRAYLCHDPDLGGMTVQVVDVKQGLQAPQQAGKRADEQLQFVIALTMEDWEMMKQVVKPEDTKMRHRDQTAVMALNPAMNQQQEQQEAGPSSRQAASQQQEQQEAGPSSRQAAHPSRPRTKKSRPSNA